MPSSYTLKTTGSIQIGDACLDISVIATFIYHPGSRETLEQPGEGPSCDLLTLQLVHDGQPREADGWIFSAMESSEDLQAEMLLHVFSEDEHARDEDADRQREDDALRAREWAKGRL